jgi:hypothetical protein
VPVQLLPFNPRRVFMRISYPTFTGQVLLVSTRQDTNNFGIPLMEGSPTLELWITRHGLLVCQPWFAEWSSATAGPVAEAFQPPVVEPRPGIPPGQGSMPDGVISVGSGHGAAFVWVINRVALPEES